MDISSIAQFFTVILLFILVLGLTYFVSRWIAGYEKSHYQGKNIEVVETYRISQNKYIQIIRLGSKYVAIAVSKDSVEKLCMLSDEDVKDMQEEVKNTTSFKDIIDLIRKDS